MRVRMEELGKDEYSEQEESGNIWYTANSGNSATLLDRRITRMKQPKLSIWHVCLHIRTVVSWGDLASAQGEFWIIVSAVSAGGGGSAKS